MGVIDYSLNGKQFRQNKIFISGGFRTLFSELKLRETKGYTWKNMNGIKTDPSEKPVFEPREITLSGWVEGDSWKQMKENFNAVMIDLTKAGTQRLICDAYGKKTIVCDVKLKDGFPLLEGKTIDGKNIGVFTLKLVEENPIKKILYTESSNLQLSFLSPKMVTVNIDGKAQQAKGNIIINKALPKRVVSGGLKNLLLESNVKLTVPPGNYRIGGYLTSKDLVIGKTYTLMFKSGNGGSGEVQAWVNGRQLVGVNETDGGIKTFTFTQVDIPVSANIIDFYSAPTTDKWGSIHWAVLVEGDNMPFKSWVPAPEDQHYISIAGNIDEITNLNTNAAVLWEILL
ncbi:hypothetical protein KRE43_12865 [Elizabethkingia meningoseptica]|uniref:hypothetical protein n=1 Tax=Elizabethkingia meningoseptica TaxID=238 RepID=UPI0023AFDC0A|nr:hypothetical protein [Elizabethkingia meningoseptica]MDE5530430.1 hypothetical protein [Elizabethkingia meningoseptica]MDE5533987.1 hypothetical protein [Elizabethkingia meningoseptica]MDE5542737.1 hypothetical protein [Elizabethkingia meningoseptica]